MFLSGRFLGRVAVQTNPTPHFHTHMNPTPQSPHPSLAFPEAIAQECRRITRLMEAEEGFTFLRLGDGEAEFLLRHQEARGRQEPRHREHVSIDAPVVIDDYALSATHYDALLHAYEQASYVDFHDQSNHNDERVARLKLQRPAGAHRNPGGEVSSLFRAWTCQELPGYLARHRVLFFAPEASLLAALLKEEAFHRVSGDLLPPGAEIHCLGVPGHGDRFWERLDGMLPLLEEAICRENIHTLFLSLSWGAKILAMELARRTGVRCFDFGSMILGLTYSASAGATSRRNCHFPYFYRVPLRPYLRALRAAQPDLAPVDLIRRAQHQLCFDLQERHAGQTWGFSPANASTLHPDPARLADFREDYPAYRELLRELAPLEPASREAVREFDGWLAVRPVFTSGKLRTWLRRLRKGGQSP